MPDDQTSQEESSTSKYFKTDNRLKFEYFDKECLSLSKSLLGKVLCRKTETNILIKGKIVETESYPGTQDVASHSYQGKQTKRNGAMFMPPGCAYVYKIYGMYHCFNISSQESGGAVLIRAVEPLEGHAEMKMLRALKRKSGGSELKDKDLCSGPSKLCQAFNITKESINEQDLTKSAEIWLEDGEDIVDNAIVTTTRIGIEGAGAESVMKPYRFYILGNIHVSVRDKKKEHEISQN